MKEFRIKVCVRNHGDYPWDDFTYSAASAKEAVNMFRDFYRDDPEFDEWYIDSVCEVIPREEWE